MSSNLINSQMIEFQSCVQSIEKNFDLIFNTVKDTLKELNSAKDCINQVCLNDKKENISNDLQEFKSNISDDIYKECDLMKESLKELINLTDEYKSFQKSESETRAIFNQNPNEFSENCLKNLINFKHVNKNDKKHPKLAEMEELISNARQGLELNGEDLVMDTPQNQIIKCPITGKPIENMVKNSNCDHCYEREAIIQYLRGKPNRRCPYAGCKQAINLAK